MGRLMRCGIVLLIVGSAVVDLGVHARKMAKAVESFEAHQLVPDVVSTAPDALLRVSFSSGVEVSEGNVLTPTQVKDIPEVSWDADANGFYTLVFSDPDAPSREEPTVREWLHWLVGNIRGNDVASGETLAEYIGSGPGPDSGLHRYVYLVYQQPGMITFDEPRVSNTSGEHRSNFSNTNFARKYNLGNPVAGNFYQAEYDDYVPVIYEQIGETN